MFVIRTQCCLFVSVTDVLKQYLRNLPEPLMTFDLYDDWLSVSVLYVNTSMIHNKV